MKKRIDSFSEFEFNWDGYDAEKITEQSIVTAHNYLKLILKTTEVNDIEVFPMSSGGIQFDIGELKEVEIFNENVNEIEYDVDYNIVNELKSVWK